MNIRRTDDGKAKFTGLMMMQSSFLANKKSLTLVGCVLGFILLQSPGKLVWT